MDWPRKVKHPLHVNYDLVLQNIRLYACRKCGFGGAKLCGLNVVKGVIMNTILIVLYGKTLVLKNVSCLVKIICMAQEMEDHV